MTTKQRIDVPGTRYTPGKSTLVFDQSVKDDWTKIHDRRRELAARLRTVQNEQEQITVNLGAWVAEGCDHKEYTDRLSELEAEIQALEAGLDHLRGQADLLKRLNSWL